MNEPQAICDLPVADVPIDLRSIDFVISFRDPVCQAILAATCVLLNSASPRSPNDSATDPAFHRKVGLPCSANEALSDRHDLSGHETGAARHSNLAARTASSSDDPTISAPLRGGNYFPWDTSIRRFDAPWLGPVSTEHPERRVPPRLRLEEFVPSCESVVSVGSQCDAFQPIVGSRRLPVS